MLNSFPVTIGGVSGLPALLLVVELRFKLDSPNTILCHTSLLTHSIIPQGLYAVILVVCTLIN